MTIHAPAHPSGTVSPQVHHHYLAWTAIVAAVILAIGALLLAPTGTFRFTSSMTDEQRSFIEYRAYERADWTASQIGPEWKSLVLFRAAEREGR
jgi:hypothetical protein